MPKQFLAEGPLLHPESSRRLPAAKSSPELKETRKKFRNLKVQFEDLDDRERHAKELLRQEALNLWKEELALDGLTWGEA